MSDNVNEVVSDDKVEPSGQDQVVEQKGYPKHFVDKVLGEKKKHASENEELKKKLAEFENQQLESQGKQSELIDSLKKQVTEKDQKLKQTISTYAQNAIFSAIRTEAVKQGCINPDDLIKLADLNALEVDTETFQVSQEDLTRLVSDMASEKTYLFQKKVAGVKDATPGVSAPTGTFDERLSKMKPDDLKNLLAMKLGQKK